MPNHKSQHADRLAQFSNFEAYLSIFLSPSLRRNLEACFAKSKQNKLQEVRELNYFG